MNQRRDTDDDRDLNSQTATTNDKARTLDTDTLTDREALLALYESTAGASWTSSDKWLSDSPVGEWHGVSADASGRVTDLTLQDNNLRGQIPPELKKLSMLQHLNLAENDAER